MFRCSIVESDPQTTNTGESQWLWGQSETPTVDGRAFRSREDATWNSDQNADMAFTVSGTVSEGGGCIIPPIPVTIDIKPGSDPNCFNSNGHGVIPVAILTTDTFDATDVDPFSVTLDGAGVRVKGNSGNAGSLQDVDGDGDLDLVVQIEDLDGTYQPGDTIATLKGETIDDTLIEGTDSICIVP